MASVSPNLGHRLESSTFREGASKMRRTARTNPFVAKGSDRSSIHVRDELSDSSTIFDSFLPPVEGELEPWDSFLPSASDGARVDQTISDANGKVPETKIVTIQSVLVESFLDPNVCDASKMGVQCPIDFFRRDMIWRERRRVVGFIGTKRRYHPYGSGLPFVHNELVTCMARYLWMESHVFRDGSMQGPLLRRTTST